jgi:2-oxoglutarate dehydrogenase E2 component (dihydrolipoamide succinyltransferase)
MPVTAKETLVDVLMPRMGVSVAEGTVATWLKSIGDAVVLDEPLLEISTDKVETEIPSPLSGTLAEILVAEGDVVPVGAPLARVRAPVRPESNTGRTGPTPPAPPVLPEAPEPGGARRASNSVARLARQLGVDLSAVTGTGPGRRVTREDLLLHVQQSALRLASADQDSRPVERAASLVPPSAADAGRSGSSLVLAAGEHAAPMSAMRREIAHRMRRSVDTAVHVTSLIEVDMTAVVAARGRRRPSTTGPGRPTILAYIARAVVSTLPKTPWLNGQIRGESIVTIDHINLGIAVSTDDGKGLLVPVIKNAADLNVDGLAVRITDLAERARSQSLSTDDLSGATFTITNLGAFGTSGGTPIINTPQVAILGTYAMVRRPVVVRDADGNEGIGIRPMMNLSMSYDHRIIDGATAGAFLQGVRSFVENWPDGSHR